MSSKYRNKIINFSYLNSHTSTTYTVTENILTTITNSSHTHDSNAYKGFQTVQFLETTVSFKISIDVVR